ncbi:casein kinase ii subunit beta [Anaeramoeba flamelloides]|uniref:Casein kinase II subunit beta n=1 Tax=Anaeramoeba flamelloides TaxID=1746091 RepID=A0ABQ8Y203_9EUKA|nr:casein kinase ii subunit beta [Anaeramoeba flamelloides]
MTNSGSYSSLSATNNIQIPIKESEQIQQFHNYKKEEQKKEEQEEVYENEYSDLEYGTWIFDFFELPEHDFFCLVDDDYIYDNFNLVGIREQVDYYEHAFQVMMDWERTNLGILQEEDIPLIEKAAVHLYGLIHARYILTEKGQQKMIKKFKNYEFGECPRDLCNKYPLLPISLHDKINEVTYFF